MVARQPVQAAEQRRAPMPPSSRVCRCRVDHRISVARGDCCRRWAVNAGPCSVAAGRDVRNNTLTCNFGLTPEQLRQVTKAAVEGTTEPLMGRIEDISKRLGVTEEAAKTLLRVVGE